MKAHIDNTRVKLGELNALSEKTKLAEKKILKSATDRLSVVQQEIDKMTGIEGMADSEQSRYLDLIKERGQLHIVTAKANDVLTENKKPAKVS